MDSASPVFFVQI